jgi:hypothetical protein
LELQFSGKIGTKLGYCIVISIETAFFVCGLPESARWEPKVNIAGVAGLA